MSPLILVGVYEVLVYKLGKSLGNDLFVLKEFKIGGHRDKQNCNYECARARQAPACAGLT